MADWICKGCNFKIYGSKKACKKCKLDRNGKNVGTANVKKAGDWHCDCGTLNFASRNACFKCGKQQEPTETRKPGDWKCPHCAKWMFASRNECMHCKLSKDDAEAVYEANACIVCCEKQIDSAFVHGDSAHKVCCYDCAMEVKNTNGNCPSCRAPGIAVVKLFG